MSILGVIVVALLCLTTGVSLTAILALFVLDFPEQTGSAVCAECGQAFGNPASMWDHYHLAHTADPLKSDN